MVGVLEPTALSRLEILDNAAEAALSLSLS